MRMHVRACAYVWQTLAVHAFGLAKSSASESTMAHDRCICMQVKTPGNGTRLGLPDVSIHVLMHACTPLQLELYAWHVHA